MNGHSRIVRNGIAGMMVIAALGLATTAQADRGHGRHEHDSCSGNDVTFSWGIQVGSPRPAGPVLFTTFEPLRGYGRWIWMPSFGTHLWFPYVEASWRPYTYGHWIHTQLGMTWVSYEPWGDIPHHYGQWVFFDDLGWGWVPGYEYAPAWVTWAVVDGYVGWAPLPPVGYRYPHVRHYRYDRYPVDYGYHGNFAYHDSGIDFSLWIFVSDRDFCGTSVQTHVLPVQRTLSLFKEKKVLPVGGSLDVDYVKRVTKGAVRTVPVERKVRSVNGRELVSWEPREQKETVRRPAMGSVKREVVKREVVKREVVKAEAVKRAAAKRTAPQEAAPPPAKVKESRGQAPAARAQEPERKVQAAPKGSTDKPAPTKSTERKTKARKG